MKHINWKRVAIISTKPESSWSLVKVEVRVILHFHPCRQNPNNANDITKVTFSYFLHAEPGWIKWTSLTSSSGTLSKCSVSPWYSTHVFSQTISSVNMHWIDILYCNNSKEIFGLCLHRSSQISSHLYLDFLFLHKDKNMAASRKPKLKTSEPFEWHQRTMVHVCPKCLCVFLSHFLSCHPLSCQLFRSASFPPFFFLVRNHHGGWRQPFLLCQLQ